MKLNKLSDQVAELVFEPGLSFNKIFGLADDQRITDEQYQLFMSAMYDVLITMKPDYLADLMVSVATYRAAIMAQDQLDKAQRQNAVLQ